MFQSLCSQDKDEHLSFRKENQRAGAWLPLSTLAGTLGNHPRILSAVEHSAHIRARHYICMHIHTCNPVRIKSQEPDTPPHQAVGGEPGCPTV